MKCGVCQNNMTLLFVSWVCDHCDKVKATVPVQKAGINDWCKQTDLTIQLYYNSQPVGPRTSIHFTEDSSSAGYKPYYTGRSDVYYTGTVNCFTVQDSNNKVLYKYSINAYMMSTGCCTCNIVLPVE